MRQQFVSNVSHEFQSPLTSIKGFSAELANDGLSPDNRKRYAEIVTLECERLSRLSEDLLKLASLDAEQYPHRPNLFRLDEQLRQVLIAVEPIWSDKLLHVEVMLDKVQITADSDLLYQVWLNLLSNSIKFTLTGGTIRISLTRRGGDANVCITDTGIGIPEQHLDRIFERFYKADRSRNRNTPGSGLGLSIVQSIVTLHGGRIQVRSEPGKGTEVTVSLPC
ncbi:sensor histidine kinase [Paenibacillus alkalitolerans]|uniref:sensor histidine kinase n=1 Tax=Paenibacillus alkalitolerans TaxID=2799335 RepID=UPI001F2C18AB|nr:HAMP domain-containing sensor histidine kinase [Paenibacillus alkalitolerans]